jgi:hypothetical protein
LKSNLRKSPKLPENFFQPLAQSACNSRTK